LTGAFPSASNAQSQIDPTADQRNAAEFQRLIGLATGGDDVETRIGAAEAALKLEPQIKTWSYTRPRRWFQGALWQILGTDYQERTTGDREDNLEKAIAAYQTSLKILPRDVSPVDWAATQNNLGEAYRKRIRDDHGRNLERAIAAFEAAGTVTARAPESWAATQLNLALAYRDRAYGAKADNIEKAIKADEAALTVYTKQKFPKDWAKTLIGLGRALRERIAGDRAENLERAIDAEKAALTVLTREDFPREWAEAQSGLASVYMARVRGDRAENLELAINSYESVLTIKTRDVDPDVWAWTQSDLATAYTNRIRGDRAENIERAIKGYEATLTVFSRETNPDDWANTQDLLGSAYTDRILGDLADNIDEAIKAYEAALTQRTRERDPMDWAHTQSNLAGAFLRRVRGYPVINSDKAIEGFKAALTVLTRETSPRDWAMVQENLGMAWIERGTGDRADNQERGIKAYEAALSVFTREAAPQEWASVKSNLSKIYAYRIRGNSADNRQRAIEAAQSAIQVYTPDADPHNFLEQVRLLGPILIENKNLQAASSIYAEGRRAFLLLFGGGLDEAQAKALLSFVGPLFTEAAFVAAEQGQNQAALGLLNEGKARLMAVALRQMTLGLLPQSRERYQKLQSDIRHWSEIAAAAKGVEGVEAIKNLEASRNELFRLIESESANADDNGDVLGLVGPLVPDHGAIVAPIVTYFGTKILIVTKAASGPVISVLSIPEFTTPRLLEFLRGGSDPADGGWLGNYLKNYEMLDLGAEADDLKAWLRRFARDEQKSGEREIKAKQLNDKEEEYGRLNREWRTAIENLGPAMWRLFAGALDKALGERGITRGSQIVWLPPGALGMLPLGLAQDPDSKRRFADTYEIVYVPSLVALKAAKDQLARPVSTSLVAVANPTGNLPFAEIEGAVVAGYFNPGARVILDGDRATPDAVLGALKGKSYWHFSTHGAFSWENALDSGLILSDGSPKGTPLTIEKLMQAQGIGRPRLVVLSACETGLYENDSNPDEFTGLPSAFISLGAAGVLATLWPVDDRATMLLTSKFYDLHLRGGLAPPEALKRAQDWLRRATRQELVAYIQEAAKTGHINSDEFASIENRFLRSNLRERFGVAISGPKAGAQPDDGQDTMPSTVPDQQPELPPFADPYFWGAFIYTGL